MAKVASASVKVKLCIQEAEILKMVSSNAPSGITAPCILFASVRETKYTLSNIWKPVGNLSETNLGNDLITVTEWNHLVLEIVCRRSEQIPVV